MKRLAIIFSLILFVSVGASQAQATSVTGGITLAYCTYIEYNFEVTDYPVTLDAIYVRFYTESSGEFYSIASVVPDSPPRTSFGYATSVNFSAFGITIPSNSNVQIKIFVNQTDENATPDFVSDFVPCIGSTFDIDVPIELPPPPEDEIFPGYNPSFSGWQAGIYPLGGDDDGFQIIGNFGLFVVTEADLAELPENPEANILLAGEDGWIGLYYLTTGEFQINLTPELDGKVLSIIFNLETGEFYTREFNIYDILEG